MGRADGRDVRAGATSQYATTLQIINPAKLARVKAEREARAKAEEDARVSVKQEARNRPSKRLKSRLR